MDKMRWVCTALVLVVLSVGSRAADKTADNMKLLIGKWEAVKVEEGSHITKGALVEFTADGTFSLSFKKDGNDISFSGTYTIDGDTVTTIVKLNGKEKAGKATIKKLTQTQYDLVDEAGKNVSFERVK